MLGELTEDLTVDLRAGLLSLDFQRHRLRMRHPDRRSHTDQERRHCGLQTHCDLYLVCFRQKATGTICVVVNDADCTGTPEFGCPDPMLTRCAPANTCRTPSRVTKLRSRGV